MKFLQQNWLILTIVALVVAMVLIRSFSGNRFRYDAVRWAASSADGSNLTDWNQLAGMTGQVLLINLGGTAEVPGQYKDRTVMIQPESVTEKGNLKVIRKNKGPVILWSGDASVAARVWMVLSEMGIKNLYILSDHGAGTPGK